MTDDVIKKLYTEYLKMVLEIEISTEYYNENFDHVKSLDDYDLVNKFDVINENNTAHIIDTSTGDTISSIPNREIHPIDDVPGLFTKKKKNGKESYCNIFGQIVSPTPIKLNGLVFTYSFGKLFNHRETFLNDKTFTYEPLLYKPLGFIITRRSGVEGSIHTDKAVPAQSKDYILFQDEDGTVYLYTKATKFYHELKYDRETNFNLKMNKEKTIIRLNNTYYYIHNDKIIDISSLFVDFLAPNNLMNTKIKQIPDDILTYEEFKKAISSNKELLQGIKDEVQGIKEKKYQQELEEAKKVKEKKEELEIIDRKKELLQTIRDVLKELKEINLKKDDEKIQVDNDILFIQVDDHKEINPIFKDSLSLIDLEYVSFKNVKVSNLDFSYSNANINPQEVYNKDMSNGNYSGLDFNNSSFKGVNICNSIFTDCKTDFAVFDDSITDDDTILPNKRII